MHVFLVVIPNFTLNSSQDSMYVSGRYRVGI